MPRTDRAAQPTPMFRDIAKSLPGWQPRVIFDVGANIGQTSARLAALFPDASIHAFEPVAASFAQLSATAVYDEHGQFLLARCGFVDITARKRVEDRLRRLLDAAPDGMLVVDPSGRIDFANPQAELLVWGEAGLLEFEFNDDTADDYDTYDAVAQDRASASAGGVA